MEYLGWLLTGLVTGVGGAVLVLKRICSNSEGNDTLTAVSSLLKSHFLPVQTNDITISERDFPFRVRADLQRAIDQLFGDETRIVHFCGVRREYSHEGVSLSDCVVESQHNPAVSIPPEHEALDIGEEEPIRVLKNGLWLLEKNDVKFAVLLSPTGHFQEITGVRFQIGTPNSSDGTRIAQDFFRHLEDSILKAESYRGKILSLE